jgi:hypothetical protein
LGKHIRLPSSEPSYDAKALRWCSSAGSGTSAWFIARMRRVLHSDEFTKSQAAIASGATAASRLAACRLPP